MQLEIQTRIKKLEMLAVEIDVAIEIIKEI